MNSTKIIKLLLENDKNLLPIKNQQNPDPDEILKGGEDPVKSLIDKLIDSKNKQLTNLAQTEISNIVNNSEIN